MSGINATAWNGRFDIYVAERGADRPWAWEVADTEQGGDVIAAGEDWTKDQALEAAHLAADLYVIGAAAEP